MMEKFIPYEKLSKKEKRRIDQAKRQTWGALSPVTRKPENSRAYNRKKSQAWKRETPPAACDFFLSSVLCPAAHDKSCCIEDQRQALGLIFTEIRFAVKDISVTEHKEKSSPSRSFFYILVANSSFMRYTVSCVFMDMTRLLP